MCFLEANAVRLLNLYSSVMLVPKKERVFDFLKKTNKPTTNLAFCGQPLTNALGSVQFFLLNNFSIRPL